MNTSPVTMPIHDLGCGGGGALPVERTLSRLLVAAVRRAGFRTGTPMLRERLEGEPDQ